MMFSAAASSNKLPEQHLKEFGEKLRRILLSKVEGYFSVEELRKDFKDRCGIDLYDKVKEFAYRSFQEMVDSKQLDQFVLVEAKQVGNGRSTMNISIFKGRPNKNHDHIMKEQLISHNSRLERESKNRKAGQITTIIASKKGNASNFTSAHVNLLEGHSNKREKREVQLEELEAEKNSLENLVEVQAEKLAKLKEEKTKHNMQMEQLGKENDALNRLVNEQKEAMAKLQTRLDEHEYKQTQPRQLNGNYVEGEKVAAEKRVNSAQAQKPTSKLPSAFTTWLSALIGDNFETSRMNAERKKRIYDFVDELQKMLRIQLGLPHMELKLFGSVNTGFGSQNSNLDICLVNTGLNTRNCQRCAAQRQRNMMRVAERLRIRTDNDFGPITSVLDARTLIINFKHEPTGFHGDISLEKTLAIYNAELLQLYTRFDKRLAPLGFAVKQWAKLCGLNDGSVGSISSYAYMVMLIHFLQRCQPPVLPFLQECEDGPSTIDTEVEGWQVRFSRVIPSPNGFDNGQSVAELFREFLHYFGCQFCPLTDVVQIRTSAEYGKRERRMPEGLELCVEDPFDLDHNLTSDVYKETLEHLLNSMRATKRGLEQFCTFALPIGMDFTELMNLLKQRGNNHADEAGTSGWGQEEAGAVANEAGTSGWGQEEAGAVANDDGEEEEEPLYEMALRADFEPFV